VLHVDKVINFCLFLLLAVLNEKLLKMLASTALNSPGSMLESQTSTLYRHAYMLCNPVCFLILVILRNILLFISD
jgi:hypothetical protein